MNLTGIFRAFSNFFLNKIDKEYISFNKRIFGEKFKTNKYLLYEINWRETSIIASSFLLQNLSKRHKAKIYCFSPNLIQTFSDKFKLLLFKLLNYKIYKINNSIGVDKYIYPILNNDQNNKAKKLFLELKKKINSKKNIINLKYYNIYFGDLLYDYHLRVHGVPTIELNSEKFFKDLNYFCQLIIFWSNFVYKNKKKIKSILIGHSCYHHGILPRICLSNNISSYEASTEYIFSHKKNNFYSFKDWDHSFNQFRILNNKKKKHLSSLGKKILNQRFKGKNNRKQTFMIWTSKYSTYTKTKNTNFFYKTNNKKLIIFAHCFYDNPHVYGKNFFADFYEWMEFLGKKSNINKKIDWYIKKHPGGLPGNDEIFKKFSKSFPRLNILPKNITNYDLIKRGFDYATTMYGNIGYELAFHEIPVIYATTNNPTSNYKFNFQVKNLKQYDYYISNPEKMKIKFDKNKISEYFISKFAFQDNNVFFSEKNNIEIEKHYSIDQNLMTNIGFKNFLENIDEKKLSHINDKINKFIYSNKFRLDKTYDDLFAKKY